MKFDVRMKALWVASALSLFLGVFSFSSNPWVDTTCSDGAVFAYIGEAMSRGQVLYRDVVDNKGPFLYWFNCIGKQIAPGMFGVWCIEILLYLLSMGMAFEFVRRRFGSVQSACAVVVHSFLYMLCAAPGNFSETYAYPFILFPVLMLSVWAEENRMPKYWESFAVGCSFSMVLLLRVNMVTFVFVVAAYYVLTAIRQKSIIAFLVTTLLSVVGAVVTCVPWLVYFIKNNALSDLVQIYWLANLVHISHKATPHVATWLCPIVVALCFAAWFFCGDRRKRCVVYNALYAILASLVICIKPEINHYFLPLVAAVPLPLGILFARFRIVGVMALCVALPFAALIMVKSNYDVRSIIAAVKSGDSIFPLSRYEDGHEADDAVALAKYIRDRDSVCVMGLDCGVYSRLGVRCKGRYEYQTCVIDMLPAMRQEILEQFASGTNRYVIAHDNQWIACLREIVETKYIKIGENGSYSLWEYNGSAGVERQCMQKR